MVAVDYCDGCDRGLGKAAIVEVLDAKVCARGLSLHGHESVEQVLYDFMVASSGGLKGTSTSAAIFPRGPSAVCVFSCAELRVTRPICKRDREVDPTRSQPEANETIAASRCRDRLKDDGAKRRSIRCRRWLLADNLGLPC